MCKVALILKNLRTASHPCWNYGPSNLLFRFRDSCMGHLNKTQTERAVMLTLPVLESYINVKTSLKVSRILADPPQNGNPLKFLQNCTKMLFYLLIFFNIINFKYIFKLGCVVSANCNWFKTYWRYWKFWVTRNRPLKTLLFFFRFTIFQIWNNFYEKSHEKTTLFYDLF